MIEQVGTDQRVEAAMVVAVSIIVNATKVTELHSGDIETGNVPQTVTPLAAEE